MLYDWFILEQEEEENENEEGEEELLGILSYSTGRDVSTCEGTILICEIFPLAD